MAVQLMSPLTPSSAPHVVFPVRWDFRLWESLAMTSGSGYHSLFKVVSVGVIFLGLIGLAYKAYKSKGKDSSRTSDSSFTPQITSPTTKTTSKIVEDLTKPRTSCVFYSKETWETLNKHVTVTQADLDAFIAYQHENGDTTAKEAHATNVKFFYGNCDASDLKEGYQDIGWGCAWRSIQTCLSSFSKFYTFQSLYEVHSSSKKLSSSEWAEPGYGQKVCKADYIPCQLYLYGRETGTSKTPIEDCIKLGFFWKGDEIPANPLKGLVNEIFSHFQNSQTPIMVDDETYACCALGIKSTTSKSGREKIILWIADPHKNSREDGLYFLVLDKNSGDKLHSTGMDKDEHGNSNGLETSQSIYPNKKGWMLLFPQKSVAISQNQAPSSSTVSSSTDDVLRVKYPSFEMYQQERNDQGDPVDLIIGRGTRHTTSNPKLNETRYVFFEQTYRPYRPFTVDIDPAVEPDFEGSVIDLKQMGYFPDASVDDIYLERLFPPSMLIDVQIYCNAARILKLFGTLIAGPFN